MIQKIYADVKFAILMYNEFEKRRKGMLPVITEEISQNTFADALKDVNTWRKAMIHYLKEENPEVNTAIIMASQQTGADPKSVALGAYLVYSMLETASAEQDNMFSKFGQ